MFHVVDYSVHLCGLGCNDTASADKRIILYEILCVCVCVCMHACVCDESEVGILLGLIGRKIPTASQKNNLIQGINTSL